MSYGHIILNYFQLWELNTITTSVPKETNAIEEDSQESISIVSTDQPLFSNLLPSF